MLEHQERELTPYEIADIIYPWPALPSSAPTS